MCGHCSNHGRLRALEACRHRRVETFIWIKFLNPSFRLVAYKSHTWKHIYECIHKRCHALREQEVSMQGLRLQRVGLVNDMTLRIDLINLGGVKINLVPHQLLWLGTQFCSRLNSHSKYKRAASFKGFRTRPRSISWAKRYVRCKCLNTCVRVCSKVCAGFSRVLFLSF